MVSLETGKEIWSYEIGLPLEAARWRMAAW